MELDEIKERIRKNPSLGRQMIEGMKKFCDELEANETWDVKLDDGPTLMTLRSFETETEAEQYARRLVSRHHNGDPEYIIVERRVKEARPIKGDLNSGPGGWYCKRCDRYHSWNMEYCG